MQWEVAVGGCKGTYEVCLERLDGALSCVHPLIVGFNEETFTLLCGEIFFDHPACLVIYHVHFNFMSLGLEKFELLLIGGKDCIVGKINNR